MPSGTRSSRSAPSAPLRLLPAPCLPLPARWCGWWWKSSRVCTLASTTRTTSPPRPPLPPSGPPSGLNFSRWTEATPWPPLPAARCSTTRSMKRPCCTPSFGFSRSDQERSEPVWISANKEAGAGPGPGPPCRRTGAQTSGRDDIDGLAPAREPNCTLPANQREQRVVSAAADMRTGVELGAALTDQDLAGVDDLAAEALHAEELRVGVATVAGAGRTLLMCHLTAPYLPLVMPVTLTWVSR